PEAPARVWDAWTAGRVHWSRPWGLAVLGHFLDGAPAWTPAHWSPWRPLTRSSRSRRRSGSGWARSTSGSFDMSFERLEPGTPEWTAFIANHEQRYAFAAERLAHLRPTATVLDAATGVGYGAAQLADRCGVRVVAVDRDRRALELARSRFQRAQAEYLEDY